MFTFTDTKDISDAGAWVHLKDGGRLAYLDGDAGEKPIRIKVLGGDSPILQERLRKRSARKLKAQNNDKPLAKRSIGEIEDFLEETIDGDAEMWADAAIAWENIPGPDGKPIDLTRDAAFELFSAYPAIVRQLNEDAGRIEDFLELAKKS